MVGIDKSCSHKCNKFDLDNILSCCLCTNDTTTCDLCLSKMYEEPKSGSRVETKKETDKE